MKWPIYDVPHRWMAGFRKCSLVTLLVLHTWLPDYACIISFLHNAIQKKTSMLCTKRLLTDVRMEPLFKASSSRKATILSGHYLEESWSNFLLVSFPGQNFQLVWYPSQRCLSMANNSYWYDIPAKISWWSDFLKVDLAGPPLPPSSLSTRARTSKPTGGSWSVLWFVMFFVVFVLKRDVCFFVATNIFNKKH